MLILVLALVASPADELQGDWYMTGYEASDGVGLKFVSGGEKPEMSISGDKLSLFGHHAGRVKVVGRGQIDLIIERGYEAGQTIRAIYKLVDGTLTVCDVEPPGQRPADFTLPQGSHRRLSTYKRKR